MKINNWAISGDGHKRGVFEFLKEPKFVILFKIFPKVVLNRTR